MVEIKNIILLSNQLIKPALAFRKVCLKPFLIPTRTATI